MTPTASPAELIYLRRAESLSRPYTRLRRLGPLVREKLCLIFVSVCVVVVVRSTASDSLSVAKPRTLFPLPVDSTDNSL
ncbi:hypothetical protein Poli38472_003457 [Pythium oligandrum]|uniref:Uncharacterized protein n=1 Tax=Pythium oligandrum TaxID=41045 RepID=A0A8K1C6N5_PYTOL|nr:hypothetical protein Poli38472_003457 [Pythium oligandrum]|eukprot:TMW57532.1 hypothetical protein Poli38472_003457 [Pythium oligandrum]